MADCTVFNGYSEIRAANHGIGITRGLHFTVTESFPELHDEG